MKDEFTIIKERKRGNYIDTQAIKQYGRVKIKKNLIGQWDRPEHLWWQSEKVLTN